MPLRRLERLPSQPRSARAWSSRAVGDARIRPSLSLSAWHSTGPAADAAYVPVSVTYCRTPPSTTVHELPHASYVPSNSTVHVG